jgi:hypothetical protein
VSGYLALPIDADEGFPQSFRVAIAPYTYTVSLYVNLLDEGGREDDATVYDLARDPRAFMVMVIGRDGAPEPEEIFRRRLVIDHPYTAGELGFLFKELRVDRRNIGAPGAFGSSVIGGVATSWDS